MRYIENSKKIYFLINKRMSEECRMNIILDLDNTIINALADSDRKKLPADFSSKFKVRDMIPFFRIYARPHIEEFLDYLFSNFNVAIMTAAEKDYALFIVKHFIFLALFCLNIFFLEEVNVKSRSRVVNKTKHQGLIKGVPSISQPFEDSTLPYDDVIALYDNICAAAGSNKCWIPFA